MPFKPGKSNKSAKQYGKMQSILHGSVVGSAGSSRTTEKEPINSTPAKKRSAFSKALRKKGAKK